MANYTSRLLFYHFFAIFILTLSFSCHCQPSSDDDRKVYIAYMGALPQGSVYSPYSHHLSLLESVLEGGSASNSLIRSYNRSFNGFVAKLTPSQKQKLASKKEIVSVSERTIYVTHTTRSWDFVGLLETVKRVPTVESDIIIAGIDSGIWPESESFSDKGFGPPPKKWKGVCNGGANFTCNNKLIGARYYSSPGSTITSARDETGHGTHTSSTAAGNYVKDVSFYDIAKGTARGGVPSARLAAYRVCDASGACSSDGVLASFDDAIADGVDVITVSLGTSWPARFFYNDMVAIGAFHAAAKGILTVQSAGNNGPSLGGITSMVPWILSVAASTTDRQIVDKVVLGNGQTLIGRTINSFSLNGSYPLMNGTVTLPNCLFGVCDEKCPSNGTMKGKILWCNLAMASMIRAARNGGAFGIVMPEASYPDVSFIVPTSASFLDYHDVPDFKAYLSSASDPTATILKSETILDAEAPAVTSFSGRGPSAITPEILKPDITAPGKEILAAFPPTCPPSKEMDDDRRVKYSINSGTSMSCPHVSGAAAYVKTFHPDWSPSAIKSSLMTTASKLKNTTEGEFAYGSGHLNPVKARKPGLVYETSEGDYINFLCNIGYAEEKIMLIVGHNFTCSNSSAKGTPRDLNYPTMTAKVSGTEAFVVQFPRRVKNVGFPNSTYKATILPKVEFDVKVVPEILSFKSLNEEKSFVVTVKGRGLGSQSMVSTSLVWHDGVHRVRSPIVVHNVTGNPII